MKKSFFLSILAVGALVACSKSEVVDTKFDQAISFENYVGRDAMTKAAVATISTLQDEEYAGIGLYGFYTGNDTAGWTAETNSNLWGNEKLAWNGTGFAYTTTKYWTNDTDKYTFFAYAPFSATAPSGTTVKDPAVSFTVDPTIKNQVDFLYSNEKKNTVKTENANGVNLKFNHALSRITVKAQENEDEYGYTIYGVSISGNFNTSGSLKLSDATWTPTAAAANYVFLADATDAVGVEVPTPTAEGVTPAVKAYDFAGTDNYLMVIPTDFSVKEGEAYKETAILTVTYTTTFDNHESNKMTKTLPINTKFEMGKAYSLNLAFEPNEDNAITFTVEVNGWGDETDVNAGNPEDGTVVNPAA